MPATFMLYVQALMPVVVNKYLQQQQGCRYMPYVRHGMFPDLTMSEGHYYGIETGARRICRQRSQHNGNNEACGLLLNPHTHG